MRFPRSGSVAELGIADIGVWVKSSGKILSVCVVLVLLLAAGLLWLSSGEPIYRGRPVSHWALYYSQKLYPSGTVPLSPSQAGLEALREMGPQKATTALVHALMRDDSRFYGQYRLFYPKLPTWYQNRFPLRLTYQQRMTVVLGATEFFEPSYQKTMVPFLIACLENPDARGQVAACLLLANMPEVAAPALPGLRHLSSSSDVRVSQAAQTACRRILSVDGN